MCGQCGCSNEPTNGALEVHHRRLELHQGLLNRNDAQAARNRAHFRAHGVLAVNLLSAPGSGKTARLEQLARHWPQQPIAVIVGEVSVGMRAGLAVSALVALVSGTVVAGQRLGILRRVPANPLAPGPAAA